MVRTPPQRKIQMMYALAELTTGRTVTINTEVGARAGGGFVLKSLPIVTLLKELNLLEPSKD